MAEKFHVEMREYFPICDVRPLAKCMELVDAADLVVVIVAERYGWIPADQAAGESRSITWLECLRAAEAVPRKEVLAFLVAKDANWPVERKDSYRASVATEKGESDEVLAEIRRDVNGLKEFKKWLNAEKVRGEFRDPSELKEQARAALRDGGTGIGAWERVRSRA